MSATTLPTPPLARPKPVTLPGAVVDVSRPVGQLLHVVAADSDPATLDFYRAALPKLGHRVQAVATGQELAEACHLLSPDLILTDTHLRGLDALAAVDAICRARPVPVLLVANADEPLSLARALAGEWVMGCLSRPLTDSTLGAALAVAARRFEQAQALRTEVRDLKQTLEDRKVIERAKWAIIKRCGVAEDEAYRRLRALASNQNQKLIDVARQVLAAEAVYANLESGLGR